MPELATPRKRGRFLKNPVVLKETVKRRRIGDVPSSSPSTPKALEAPRRAAIPSRAPNSRAMAPRRSSRRSSRYSTRVNGMIADDLQEELNPSPGDDLQDKPELLDSDQSSNSNEQPSFTRLPKITRWSVGEPNDTISTKERRRNRPQEPQAMKTTKTTKNSGSHRDEHLESGLLTVSLPGIEKDGPVDTISLGDWMQHSSPQEVLGTPTKRKRGRPRKPQLADDNASNLSDRSENGNGTVNNGRSAAPDALHDSVSQNLGGTPTGRKGRRLQNLAPNHTNGFPSPSMDSVLSDPYAVDETPTRRKRGPPRNTSVNQSQSSPRPQAADGEPVERLTSHEEMPMRGKRGRTRKIPIHESESTATPPIENEPPTSGEESHPPGTVAHSRMEHRANRRAAPSGIPTLEDQLIELTIPPGRRERSRKTVNFEDEAQSGVVRALGFKDILGRGATDTTSTKDIDPSVAQGQDHKSLSSQKSPPSRNSRGRLRKERFALSLPQEGPHPIPLSRDQLVSADAVHLREQAQDPTLNQQVKVLKGILLEKLTGRRGTQLIGLDDEQGKVRQILEQTVVAGEGNSMLLIGARGSGKSMLVEKSISELAIEHGEDFHTVRLSGFIHTDDRLALREIWRQLGIEMEVEDELTGKASNYADILSSLLALLSHPSELPESAPNHTTKSVIFILNEFDLFASHPRQTLLYNLFDIAQGRKAPILVLGLTTRIDVVDSLEKRVKSRFSHRHVHLSLPKSLTAFWEICRQALLISEDDIQTAEERAVLMPDQEGDISQIWNGVVEELRNDNDFRRLLQSIFYTTKGIRDFHAACLLPIINLSPQNLHLKGLDFTENSLAPPESKLHILEGLSDLELSLLIAAARLDIILDTDTCNFNMAYDEYTTLVSRVRLQSSASGAAAVGAGSKIWGREVGLGAWERLAEYGLIISAVGGATGAAGSSGMRDVGRMGRMFRVDVGLEEIWQSTPNLGAVMTKWCTAI